MFSKFKSSLSLSLSIYLSPLCLSVSFSFILHIHCFFFFSVESQLPNFVLFCCVIFASVSQLGESPLPCNEKEVKGTGSVIIFIWAPVRGSALFPPLM